MSTPKRHSTALQMRQSGSTLAEIGEALGVSGERARQIIKKAESARGQWHDGLSKRVANNLVQAGFDSRQSVRDAIRDGVIAAPPDNGSALVPGIGRRAIDEICEWLGVGVPEPIQRECAASLKQRIVWAAVKWHNELKRAGEYPGFAESMAEIGAGSAFYWEKILWESAAALSRLDSDTARDQDNP